MSATSAAKTALRTMLANTTAMQTWLGVADATAALTRILIGGFDEPADQPTRPFVVLRTQPGSVRAQQIGVGTGLTNGTITLIAEAAISGANESDADGADAEKDDKFGDLLTILNDLRGAEAGGVRMLLRDIAASGEAGFPEPQELTDNTKPYPYWTGAIEVAWGPEG